MLTALRIYNIFFWNSTPKEKPTELHWYAHAGGWQPKPLMLKETGTNNFINLKIKKNESNKIEPCKHTG